MVRIPVIRFGGLQPPQIHGPGEELSRRMGEGLSEALGDEGVRADVMLEVLAVWVAALITVHPISQEYLAEHFAAALAERMGATRQ